MAKKKIDETRDEGQGTRDEAGQADSSTIDQSKEDVQADNGEEITLVGCLQDAGSMIELDKDGCWVPDKDEDRETVVDLVKHLFFSIVAPKDFQQPGTTPDAIPVPWPALMLGLMGISQHHDMPFRPGMQTVTDMDGNSYSISLDQVESGQFVVEIRVEYGKMAYSQMLDRKAQIERESCQLINQIRLIKSADGYETSVSEMGVQRRKDVAEREARLAQLESENVDVEIDEPVVETYQFPVDGSVKVFASGAVRL